jgi:MYXO-CTERM domain-containing protein
VNEPVLIDFTGFNGSGFNAVYTPGTNGRFVSPDIKIIGFDYGTLNYNGDQYDLREDFARGNFSSGVSTSGIYGFNVGTGSVTDPTLGWQPGNSDMTPGTFTFRYQNLTGVTLHAFDVSYEVWVRNDQASSYAVNMAYAGEAAAFTTVGDLAVITPGRADSSPAFVRTLRETTVNATVLPNEYFYLQFQGDDASGTGSRDEIALDDISVTAHTPEPGTATTMLALGAAAALRRRRRSA